MNCRSALIGLVMYTVTPCTATAQHTTHSVKVVGQMKDVMWKGQLYGNIYLDTIANKTNLYGFGPVEYLTGEILIINGRSYRSTVLSDTTMTVEETYQLKAPFFGYANIAAWVQQPLPDSILTMKQLEQFLHRITAPAQRPFLFRLSGTVAQATIHIVNLPKGSKVHSPAEAHEGQKNYGLNNVQADIIGFFSTQHQGIFTHHDHFLHLHLITADRQKMGHVDSLLFEKGAIQLYLPAE